MKRSLFGLVCLLVTSVASLMLAAQNAEPPANPTPGAAAPARQGGGRQGGARQGGAAAQDTTPALPPVPLLGLAQVTVKAADLAKSRKYYNGVLGFAEAFDIKDASGKVTSAYFKINDDQYIEVTPNLKPEDIMRMARLVFESSDLDKLHAIYVERGLNPTPISKGGDGNPVFEVIGPSDAHLDFFQIVPGSQQARARGKFLDPGRLSTHLGHVGIYTQDRTAAGPFYQKIGFVGGMDIPLIRRFQCGFEQGIKYANPKAELIANMTGTTPAAWNDPGRGAELAKGQFDRGVDVVYAAAGNTGTGVLQAAKDRGKYAIGVDSNQNYLHPGTMLTSMLKRVDLATYNSFKAAQAGTWKGGTQVLGLKEGGVDWALDKDNEKLITADMKAKVNAAKADIESGKIVVHDYMSNNSCK